MIHCKFVIMYFLADYPGLCPWYGHRGWNWSSVYFVDANCRILFLLLPLLWEMRRGDVAEGQSK